jgi:DNA-binding HxlR family transcriptional regulator
MEKLEQKGALRILLKMLEMAGSAKVSDLKEQLLDMNYSEICHVLEDLAKIGLVQEKKEEDIPETRIARLTDFGVQIAEKIKYIHDIFYG